MGRATERMLSFARDIAAELDMEMPTTHGQLWFFQKWLREHRGKKESEK